MHVLSQGPEEMCLSLEHQNPSKTSEKWVILIALQFRYTFYRPHTNRLRARKIGLQYIFYSALRASVALRATWRAPARIWFAVIDFQNGELQSRSGSDRKWARLPVDCSQSPIFSWDRLDIPRLTATAILIFKCTEGAGVGDYSSRWGGGWGRGRRGREKYFSRFLPNCPPAHWP